MGSIDSSSPLVVEKSEVVLVKPSKPTPDVSLSLSTIDNNPTNEIILKTICVFAPKPYLKDQAKYDPAFLLRYALSNALVYYYPLAGKLHRRSKDNRLLLNYKAGDGVPFISATAACTLSSLNYLDTADHLDVACQLVPCYDPVKGCQGYDPLALQVTKFACGGITIGMAHSHAVCDGVGAAQFFRAMIEMASGKLQQPTIIPVWDRDMLTCNNIDGELGNVAQNPNLADLEKACFSPDTPNEEMVREILNVTSEDITKLKNMIMDDTQISTIEEEKNVAVTTVEVLAAYVWRARCRALNVSPEKTTALGISVGIRNTVEPPLPEGYYGNAFVPAYVTLTVKELNEMPISRIVKLIKEAKSVAMEKGYVSEQLRWMEKRIELKLVHEEIRIRGVVMTLTDWRHIGLHQDVWGGLVNIVPLIPLTMPYLCVLLPASKTVRGMKGGVRVLVTLPRDAMTKFKEEMDALHP